MNKIKFIFIIVLLILFPLVSQAANYYVDQSGGNDSNAGSSASPWKNGPGMGAYTGSEVLVAGDVVYFDCEDTWTISSVGLNGNGERCDNRTTALCMVGGVQYIGDTWKPAGGTCTGRAKFDATIGYETTPSMRTFINFTRDHATYETVVKGFELDGNGNDMNGIGFQTEQLGRPSGTDHDTRGATKRAENNVIHDCQNNHGSYHYGIRVHAMEDEAGDERWVKNVEIINNTIYNIGRDGIVVYPNADYMVAPPENITIRGNHVYAVGQQSDYTAGSLIFLKGALKNVTVEYNYVHDSADAVGKLIGIGGWGDSSGSQENIIIRYNIVDCGHRNGKSGDGCLRWYDDTPNNPRQIDFYGNIVYDSDDCSDVGGGLSLCNTGANTFRAYNNTFYNACMWVATGGTYNTLDIRNNISYGTHSGITKNPSGGTLSNNLTTDPGFKNVANLPTGFTGTYPTWTPNNDGLSALSVASAMVDTGADLGSSYNKAINGTRTGTWDIGAYEYGAGSTPPSATGCTISGGTFK